MTLYDDETKQNLEAFYGMLRKVRPDLYELIDTINATGANPRVLVRIARHLENLCLFYRWGEIRVILNDASVVTVSSINTEKCSEPALVQPEELII